MYYEQVHIKILCDTNCQCVLYASTHLSTHFTILIVSGWMGLKSVDRMRISMNIAGGGTLSMNFLSTFHFWPWASLTAHLVQGEAFQPRKVYIVFHWHDILCMLDMKGGTWLNCTGRQNNEQWRKGRCLPFSFPLFHFRTPLWLHALVCSGYVPSGFKIITNINSFHHRFMDMDLWIERPPQPKSF